ncbi:MAG TPA: glycosyltransferase family 2 protein [Gemmatimonadaceae bacterium]|nr:glycosyltransferase family 2 protein [Gemmatimonadaceae bacterium]
MSAPTVRATERGVPTVARQESASPDARAAPVAAVVLTYNEERNLPDCLSSLAGWVQEIFVVDSGSTDRTVAIAREAGATVLHHAFEHYGAQRNWAIDNVPVTAPWTLHVDADERITPELRESIATVLGRNASSAAMIEGFLVSRRTMFMGRWIRHGGHYPAWHLRLIRTGAGRCEDRLYDQHFYVSGAVQKLQGDLIDTLTPDLATFTARHLRWAALEAAEHDAPPDAVGRIRGRLATDNAIERRRWWREWYARLPLFVRPAAYFLYRYVVRLGFLDGRAGLVFHVLQGFWFRFLVDALILERRVRRREGRAAAAKG